MGVDIILLGTFLAGFVCGAGATLFLAWLFGGVKRR